MHDGHNRLGSRIEAAASSARHRTVTLTWRYGPGVGACAQPSQKKTPRGSSRYETLDAVQVVCAARDSELSRADLGSLTLGRADRPLTLRPYGRWHERQSQMCASVCRGRTVFGIASTASYGARRCRVLPRAGSCTHVGWCWCAAELGHALGTGSRSGPVWALLGRTDEDRPVGLYGQVNRPIS